MKVLFDGFTKNVSTLVSYYKFLKDWEFRVWDEKIPLEGFDLLRTKDIGFSEGQYVIGEFGAGLVKGEFDENHQIAMDAPEDSRRIKTIKDWEEALAWCDIYVNFESVEFIMDNYVDKIKAKEICERIVSHVEQAKMAGKRVYLGHRWDSYFESVIASYKNIENNIINNVDYEDILQYHPNFVARNELKIIGVYGTFTGSGKFSAALRMKAKLEKEGKKVCVVITEETFPFFDEAKGFYGFCRNFSDLTLDQEAIYYQALIGKIVALDNPDYIIVATQGSFPVKNDRYVTLNENLKLKGVLPFMVEQFISPEEAVVTASYDTVVNLEPFINYLQNSTDVVQIYISPIPSHPMNNKAWGKDLEFDGVMVNVKIPEDFVEVNAVATGLALKYPSIDIVCDYFGLTEYINKWKLSEEFRETRKTYLVEVIKNLIDSNFNIREILLSVNDSYLQYIKDMPEIKDILEGK